MRTKTTATIATKTERSNYQPTNQTNKLMSCTVEKLVETHIIPKPTRLPFLDDLLSSRSVNTSFSRADTLCWRAAPSLWNCFLRAAFSLWNRFLRTSFSLWNCFLRTAFSRSNCSCCWFTKRSKLSSLLRRSVSPSEVEEDAAVAMINQRSKDQGTSSMTVACRLGHCLLVNTSWVFQGLFQVTLGHAFDTMRVTYTRFKEIRSVRSLTHFGRQQEQSRSW